MLRLMFIVSFYKTVATFRRAGIDRSDLYMEGKPQCPQSAWFQEPDAKGMCKCSTTRACYQKLANGTFIRGDCLRQLKENQGDRFPVHCIGCMCLPKGPAIDLHGHYVTVYDADNIFMWRQGVMLGKVENLSGKATNYSLADYMHKEVVVVAVSKGCDPLGRSDCARAGMGIAEVPVFVKRSDLCGIELFTATDLKCSKLSINRSRAVTAAVAHELMSVTIPKYVNRGFGIEFEFVARMPQKIPKKLKADRDVVLAILERDGTALEYASDGLKADRGVVMAAIERDGTALEYASDELKADREMVMAAIEDDGLALEFASDELKADREVVMAAIEDDGTALEYASDELKADREVVMAAIEDDGTALEHASDELKADSDVVMAAIKRNSDALRYAAKELLADRYFAMTLAKQDAKALFAAPEELKVDREIVMTAVEQDGMALQYVPNEFKADRGVVMAAVKNNGWALRAASKQFRADRGVVIAAVANRGFVLAHASKKLRDDRGVVMAAVMNRGLALSYASKRLKADHDIVMAAVANNDEALKYASIELKSGHGAVAMAANANHSGVAMAATAKVRGVNPRSARGPFAGRASSLTMTHATLSSILREYPTNDESDLTNLEDCFDHIIKAPQTGRACSKTDDCALTEYCMDCEQCREANGLSEQVLQGACKACQCRAAKRCQNRSRCDATFSIDGGVCPVDFHSWDWTEDATVQPLSEEDAKKLLPDGDKEHKGVGFELVSPPLSGKEGMKSAVSVMTVLKRMGIQTGGSSALHVHVNVASTKVPGTILTPAMVANVWVAFARFQLVIDEMLSPSRPGHRYARRLFLGKCSEEGSGHVQFCSDEHPCHCAKHFFKQIHAYVNKPPSPKSPNLDDFCNAALALPGDPTPCEERRPDQRYYAFNLVPLSRLGTVEFRAHSATYDTERVWRWTQFVVGFVEHFGVDAPYAGQRFFDSSAEVDLLELAAAQREATAVELFAALGDKINTDTHAFFAARSWEDDAPGCGRPTAKRRRKP